MLWLAGAPRGPTLFWRRILNHSERLQSLFRRRLRFCAHVAVCGLRRSLLPRIGWTCFIIAIFEDDHLHPLMAELLCFRLAGHVDVDVVAVHLPASVFHGIVAGIPASAIN